jgi:hypothetical protein
LAECLGIEDERSRVEEDLVGVETGAGKDCGVAGSVFASDEACIERMDVLGLILSDDDDFFASALPAAPPALPSLVTDVSVELVLNKDGALADLAEDTEDIEALLNLAIRAAADDSVRASSSSSAMSWSPAAMIPSAKPCPDVTELFWPVGVPDEASVEADIKFADDDASVLELPLDETATELRVEDAKMSSLGK